MTVKESQKYIAGILTTNLPKGLDIAAKGRALSKEISIGRTLFCSENGVASEKEFKRSCMAQGRIMTHAHIGMGDWNGTADALLKLHHASQDLGFQIDRFGLCLDRRMGLPVSNRIGIPSETGPMLESGEDWAAIGNTVPIQPHMGDFMIGFPAAVENTVKALEQGITTIGNLSQFFSHEAPGWEDHAITAAKTTEAIALLGAFRNQGTLMHSYLEDGYGALFMDCATIAGWAFLEKYIVQDLLGAKLSHCIGGLTCDPVKRAGWVFALDKIHDGDCIGSMFYGDTISFTRNMNQNNALVCEYLLWDILAQMKCPTGHALHPLPKTEGIRIPSAIEIIEAQNLGYRVKDTAVRLFPHVDFSACEHFADTVVRAGRQVCANALDGLKTAGADINDPVQLLFVLKKIGPVQFENWFGLGKENPDSLWGRDPIVMTDVFENSLRQFETHLPLFMSPENKKQLTGKRLLIASTDVHEHAIILLRKLCREAGAFPIYLGAEQSAAQVATAAKRASVDAILLSTHNGVALDYASLLDKALMEKKIKIPVIMGGVLNQKKAGHELPVDVTEELIQLGFFPRTKLEGGLPGLIDFENNTGTAKNQE